jgi:hypothetical protein
MFEYEVRRLNNADWWSRQYACEALGKLRGLRGVEPLIGRLTDEAWNVREAACDALGEIRDSRAVRPLTKRLRDEHWSVRRAACEALGRLGDVSVVESLIQRLGDEHLDVCCAAALALGELGDSRAVMPLIQSLGNGYYMRKAACRALGKLGDVRAVEPLIQRLGDAHDVCRAAALALDELGEGRLAWAVVGAIEGYVESRANLARLAQEGDLRAAEPLMQHLAEGHYFDARHAVQGLKSICRGVKEAHRVFCRLCLAAFHRRDHRLERVGTVSISVCRLCGRAANAIPNVRELVAVLDTEMSEELSCTDGVARVSYLKRDAPFDFDRVEIVRAGDYEVERFCVQVANDADPFRKRRYGKMRCVVAPGCRLSENTLRILRSMFGTVEVRA